MSTLYLLALAAVGLAVLVVTVEAVLAVTRKKSWPVASPTLVLVQTEDRRAQPLPYVGAERRKDAMPADGPPQRQRA